MSKALAAEGCDLTLADRVVDPLNEHLATDPMGANSVVHAPGYVVPDWTRPDENARPAPVSSVS